jgi:hypothetical protein
MNRSEQLEQLLSERLDGTLTAEELTEVQRTVAGDPKAAATLQQYERLHGLLANWRSLPANVDWKAFAAATSAGVSKEERLAATQRGASSAADDDVDRLVRRAAGDMPEVDWAALKSGISAAVQREAEQTRRETVVVSAPWRRVMSWTGRVGLPLAAAAAIALLVWLPQTGDHGRRGADSKSPLVLVSLDAPTSGGRVSVSFEGLAGGAAGRVEVGVEFDETAAPAAPANQASGTAIVLHSSGGRVGGSAAESFDDTPLF